MGTHALVQPLLMQTLTSIKEVATDGYGTKSESILYSDIPCRWQEISKFTMGPLGEAVLATNECWVGADYEIKAGYIFVFENDEYTVIRKSKKYDLFGQPSYIKVWLIT